MNINNYVFDYLIGLKVLAHILGYEDITHEVADLELFETGDVGLFEKAFVDLEVNLRNFGDEFLILRLFFIIIEGFFN